METTEKSCQIKMLKWLLLFVSSVIFISTTEASTFTVTDQVYLDIMIDEKPVGRIIIGLFGTIVPKTVKNFMIIASTGINGQTYSGTKFHRVIKRFMIQGGDIVNNDGSGTISIYGLTFADENFDVSHSAPLFVSMVNSGKDSNGCQFFITTTAAQHLDGSHTVFGKVIEGQDIVFKIEQVKTDVDDKPVKPVMIMESGVVPTSEPFVISDDPYNAWQWIKATFIPLSFSFAILGFFHWMMKKLDI